MNKGYYIHLKEIIDVSLKTFNSLMKDKISLYSRLILIQMNQTYVNLTCVNFFDVNLSFWVHRLYEQAFVYVGTL